MSAAGTPYTRLPVAVPQETVEATPLASPDDLVKTYLLHVTSELLAIQASTTSFGASSTDRYSPSLQVLHARLQDGHHSPFPGLENRSGNAFTRKGKAHRVAVPSPMVRPLGDFEDMYYAILATVKETHDSIILRLNNGFVDPNALLFPSSQHTIHFFQEWLAHQWTILNEPSLVRALDIAVREALVDGHLCQGLRSQVDSGQITHEQAETARAHLYQSDVFADMPGLSWVGNEHSAMINGRLNEKYRVVFQAEKQAHEKKIRMAKKRERIQKTAKIGPKACGRRGSGEYRRQQQQVMAEQAQQAADMLPTSMGKQSPRSEAEQAKQAHDIARQTPQVDHSDISLFQEEVEAWRLYTQQLMSSRRETQLRYHEDELRRKTPPAATEQALQALPDSLRSGAVSCTPQRQSHARTVTQPHAAHVQQDTSDAGHAGPERTFPGASPREKRKQRVTEYQAWLRESASDHARTRMMGQRRQTQAQASDVSDVSLQAFNGAEAPMDMDGDGGF
ncbi:uncharacterized protein CC84DRAFT_1163170 [Paraphaeosphaeria sporulosa]|uniref:Uncharacterized protein n=1 Tax=Paraphaeosphaeria sporulosa TaxID=1460663 RepID=A0A177CHS3_9PLEO|nr:uncharacterized protein CC84DRAFT_1163170 [Paraphaeosphaeria sporulosa]OAG06866.1 hypothetical protein CC84DRAFT_1163170 [Paraphaeosphaeria sporulosa]